MRKKLIAALFCVSAVAGMFGAPASPASAHSSFIDPAMVHGENYWKGMFLKEQEQEKKATPARLAAMAFGLKNYEASANYFAKIEKPDFYDYAIQALNAAESSRGDAEKADAFLSKMKAIKTKEDEPSLHFVEGFLSEMAFRRTHDKKDFQNAIKNYVESDTLNRSIVGDNRLVRLMEDNKEMRNDLPSDSDAFRLWKKGRKHWENPFYEENTTDPVKEIRQDVNNRYLLWYRSKTTSFAMY